MAKGGTETVLKAHRAAATLKEASVGVAGRLQPFNSIGDLGVSGETRRKTLGRSKRADNLGIAPVRVRPVDFSDDLRQRLRGGRRLLLRRGEGA